jgi:hypothetical protein
MTIDYKRSIDHRAPRQEWLRLLQWIEEATVLVMDSNNNPNPWLKPVPRVPKEDEHRLQPSTGFYAESRHEEIRDES